MLVNVPIILHTVPPETLHFTEILLKTVNKILNTPIRISKRTFTHASSRYNCVIAQVAESEIDIMVHFLYTQNTFIQRDL